MRDEKEAEDEVGGAQDAEDEEEADRRAMEKVRRYQVNRLKYFYAVAELDSASSASKVYEECDGKEYELSATRFDLRFIPANMEFDETPRSSCSSMPDMQHYKPKLFTTSALQLEKVELTWDEDDPRRSTAMRRAFETASDDEEGAEVARELIGSDEDNTSEGTGSEEEAGREEGTIEKYKKLLSDLAKRDSKKQSKWDKATKERHSEEEEEGDMEMVFEVEGAGRKKSVAESTVAKMTPWEKYLHKKKEKMKAKRQSKQGTAPQDDDDGFDDPFFNDHDQPKSQKGKKKAARDEKGEDINREAADLSLFTMDSDDEKAHFDYKDIVKKESKEGKKKKKVTRLVKEKKKIAPTEEDFKLNLEDRRFSAVFNNPDFNVDPSHPSFKKTKSMQKIITEKQKRILKSDKTGSGSEQLQPSKRRKKCKDKEVVASGSGVTKSPGSGSENLDRLVKSVRAKTKESPGKKRKKRR